MAEVLLSTEDLDVFGGPSSIDVSVDFGATGQRGSFIWSGTLPPEQQLINQEILLLDFYINTNTGQVFQYILEVGNPVWVPIFNLTLPQVSSIVSLDFNAQGQGDLIVPTSLINPYQDIEPNLLPIVVDDLVIRYNIQAPAPASSTFFPVIQTNPMDGVEYLIITVAAIVFDPTTGQWGPLTGQHKVHWFVTWLGGGN
jgi:hypothetical protein